jgi:two-component system chemotaxis response regulator CheB
MDGITTLAKIMAECPTPVVMLSSLTGSGTETTIRALEKGAVDFFLKHSLANPVGAAGSANDLRTKIITASKVKFSKQTQENSAPKEKPKKIKVNNTPAERVVVIGSSTGGPKALYRVIPQIPADIPAAILIVQHMPPGFTQALAQRLDQLSNVSVKECSESDVLHHGVAYLAKGGVHMVVEKGGILTLSQSPPVCNVRPSVDVTMKSAVKIYGSAVLGVVLTGMGSDGTNGSQAIKESGGEVIAEDESSCVVFGMPKSVIEAGYADKVMPLPLIPIGIMDALKDKVKE